MQDNIPKLEHRQPEQPSNRCIAPILSHLLLDMQLHNVRNPPYLHDADTHLPIYTTFSQFYTSAPTPSNSNIFNSGSRHLATTISSSISTALYTQNPKMEGNSILLNSKGLGVDNEPIDSNTQHWGEFIDHRRSCPHRFCHSPFSPFLLPLHSAHCNSTCSPSMLAVISSDSGLFCSEIWTLSAISSSCGPLDRVPHVSHCSPIALLPYLHAVMKRNAEQSANPRRVAQRVQKRR